MSSLTLYGNNNHSQSRIIVYKSDNTMDAAVHDATSDTMCLVRTTDRHFWVPPHHLRALSRKWATALDETSNRRMELDTKGATFELILDMTYSDMLTSPPALGKEQMFDLANLCDQHDICGASCTQVRACAGLLRWSNNNEYFEIEKRLHIA